MEDAEKQSIAHRIKIIAEEKGTTVSALERESGLGTGTLSRAIRDSKGINTETLDKVLDLWPDVKVEFIVCGTGDKYHATNITSLDMVNEPLANYDLKKIMARIIATEISDPVFEEELIKELNAIVERRSKKY